MVLLYRDKTLTPVEVSRVILREQGEYALVLEKGAKVEERTQFNGWEHE